jgi:hypothetical protein
MKHGMTSGALPPTFLKVSIAGELYGGDILSNTPTEALPREDSVKFSCTSFRFWARL